MSPHFLLICALLAGNVLLRTFTNGFALLPRALNLAEIPIVGLLFFLSLTQGGASARPSWINSISNRLIGFSAVAIVGVLLNLSYFYPTAAASQFIMLMEGLVLFLALTRLPFTNGELRAFQRLLAALLVLEVFLGFCQLPSRLRLGDSEIVHGTFPGNAEQYAVFVTIGIFYLAGLARIRPERAVRYGVLVCVILALVVSIDNKASWLGLVVAMGLVFWKTESPLLKRIRKFGPVVIVVFTAIAVALLATKVSNTLRMYSERLGEAWSEGQILKLGKIKAYQDVLQSWRGNPHMALVGAGLGNFYSRSGRAFYRTVEIQAQINKNLPDQSRYTAWKTGNYRASDSMGGIIHSSARDPFYAQFCQASDPIFPIGSEQVDWPFSPYVGLLGEVGLLGALLYLSAYWMLFKYLGLEIWNVERYGAAYPMVVATYGLLIYMLVNSVYGPWLETGRFTTILWGMAAMVVHLQRSEQAAPVVEPTEVIPPHPDFSRI